MSTGWQVLVSVFAGCWVGSIWVPKAGRREVPMGAGVTSMGTGMAAEILGCWEGRRTGSSEERSAI